MTSISYSAFTHCASLQAIYFGGMANDWYHLGMYDDNIEGATVYFYSETSPAKAGNYWHYVDGVPTAW